MNKKSSSARRAKQSGSLLQDGSLGSKSTPPVAAAQPAPEAPALEAAVFEPSKGDGLRANSPQLIAAKHAEFWKLINPNEINNRAEFVRLTRAMRWFIKPGKEEAFFDAALRYVEAPMGDPWTALQDQLLVGPDLWLGWRAMRFQSRKSLGRLLDKILVRQDFQFKVSTGNPLLLDCGAGVGLAIYYFLRTHPMSRIRAYEPNPSARELLERNISRNKFNTVDVRPEAISFRSGEATLWVSESEPDLATITEAHASSPSRQIVVPALRLADAIDEPVEMLKLDIAGAEVAALEDASDRLSMVQNLVCECYDLAEQRPSSLSRTVRVLEECGFDVRVGRSEPLEGFGTSAEKRFLGPYSTMVFASRSASQPT